MFIFTNKYSASLQIVAGAAAVAFDNDGQPSGPKCTKNLERNLVLGLSEIANGMVDIDDKMLIGQMNIEDKLKCVIRAIDEAVKGANVADVWNEAKKQLEHVLLRTKACRTEQTIKDELL